MKLSFSFLIVVIASVMLLSCGKPGSDSGGAYPKQVSITYRVTSPAIDSLVLITYDNETGGKTSVDNPRLPFVKTISKTVRKYDIIVVGYFVNPAKNVKLEILVNNKVVKSQDYNSPNSAMSYTFE